jgi:hypothetical protein
MSGFSRLTFVDGEAVVTDDPFSGASMESGSNNAVDPHAAAESLRNAALPSGDYDKGTMRLSFNADGTVSEFSRVDLESSGSKPSVTAEYQHEINALAAEVEKLEAEAESYKTEDGSVPPHLQKKYNDAVMQATALRGEVDFQVARGNQKVDEDKLAREAFIRELEADMQAQREAMAEAAQTQRKRRYRR